MKTIEQAAEEYLIDRDYNHNISNAIEKIAFKTGIEFAQQWISVDDELPEHAQQVIMKSENRIIAGFYEYKTFRNHKSELVYDVTEWRPIYLK